jgi:glutamate racemase
VVGAAAEAIVAVIVVDAAEEAFVEVIVAAVAEALVAVIEVALEGEAVAAAVVVEGMVKMFGSSSMEFSVLPCTHALSKHSIVTQGSKHSSYRARPASHANRRCLYEEYFWSWCYGQSQINR